MRKHNDLSIMKQLFYISLAALMLLSISCNKDDKYGVDGMTPLPEAVDLGLPSGLKWSSFNLGASKEYKCGDYYVFFGGDALYQPESSHVEGWVPVRVWNV